MKLAVIPARGGSQRIKNKNFLDFCGKPMIAYALEEAKKSRLFDKIHVSTESVHIQSLVEELEYPVDFLRPPELADNFTGLIPVLQWVLKQYHNRGLEYEDVCCIMPTAPLLEPQDLIRAYDVFSQNEKQHPLLVVAKLPVPVEWVFRRDERGVLTSLTPEALSSRSQDLKKAFYEAGPFSFFHASHLSDHYESPKEPRFLSYLLTRNRAVDIDDADDLLLAKTLYLGNQAQKKDISVEERRMDYEKHQNR